MTDTPPRNEDNPASRTNEPLRVFLRRLLWVVAVALGASFVAFLSLFHPTLGVAGFVSVVILIASCRAFATDLMTARDTIQGIFVLSLVSNCYIAFQLTIFAMFSGSPYFLVSIPTFLSFATGLNLLIVARIHRRPQRLSALWYAFISALITPFVLSICWFALGPLAGLLWRPPY